MKDMKHVPNSILLCILLAFMLSACKEDEKEIRIQCLTITETSGSGPERVTAVQQFNYTDGKLMQHVTTQTYTDLLNQGKYTQTVSTSVSYEPGKVIITDDTGTVSTYLLNDYGYAASCTRTEPAGSVRTYQFSYLPAEDGILDRIQESINGSPYSEILLATPSAETVQIIEKLDNFKGTFIATVNDDYPGSSNTQSRLPWLYLTERYPLSLHVEAYYAHILGEPLSTLPGYLTIEGSDEITTFNYQTDSNNRITSCAVRTSVSNRSWSRYVEYAYTME